MKKWQSIFWYIILVWPGKHAKSESSPLTGTNTVSRGHIDNPFTQFTTNINEAHIVDNVPRIPMKKIQQSSFKSVTEKITLDVTSVRRSDSDLDFYKNNHSMKKKYVLMNDSNLQNSKNDQGYDHPPIPYPVIHAGVPRGLAIYPVPLQNSDHELAFNVTWEPPIGPPVRSYSVEVHSVTDTAECRSDMCYEYNIPGDSRWKVVPEFASPVAEGCSVRPGCSYRVRLIPHPWDGHTSANLDVELDECVVGVCSCAHARCLPTPTISAHAVSVHGALYVNVSWSLPVPPEPLRLPPRLMKRYYLVSIGKQMVSDVHPAPWFAHTVSRRVDATGFVVVPEDNRWLLVPVVEGNGESVGHSDELDGNTSGERKGRPRSIVLDLKLLARVSLIDERGCLGPAGNTVAYDPAEASTTSIWSYMLWSVFGGTVVLAMVLLLAVGKRAIKRVLKSFGVPTTTPLQPLSVRPLWFPIQLHRLDDQ